LWLKNPKDQSIAMNMKAREIVNHEPLLFEKKFADQHINDELKKIMAILKFKESYLSRSKTHLCYKFSRAGGQVEKLKDYWDIPISNKR
jgi:hypothetical protein